MKLLRLKITDPQGFRSLQPGFEYHFRTESSLQEEKGFAPFICAGPNGSGKSNLLEALAAIFYHLECIYLQNKPDSFLFDEVSNPRGFQGAISKPDAFELVYQFGQIEKNYYTPAVAGIAQAGRTFAGATGYSDRVCTFEVHIHKESGRTPVITRVDLESGDSKVLVERDEIRAVLPDYVLGYSSGENEILSLPFFKTRFVQYDEYWQSLKQQLPYDGRPESRLVYLDSGYSQAILLCNLLFHDSATLTSFHEDVKIRELVEFRIIVRRSTVLDEDQIMAFGDQDQNKRVTTEEIVKDHPALSASEDVGSSKRYRVNLVHLLEAKKTNNTDDEKRNKTRDQIIPRLSRCATCSYMDETTDTLYLDYLFNDATRQAFKDNFSNDPLELFQAFQVLLSLNLFSVSEPLKADLYQSDSHYVSETVPTLASDERIMRFKFVRFRKADVAEPVMLKNLSDGEHQLLHTMGLCLLFKNTQSLFLLDEPETHFNPAWRANFVTRLHQSFKGTKGPEMLIATHTPFLISDSRPEKVLVFSKDNGAVTVSHPGYNTLGASINKITMSTFEKRDTIGGLAHSLLSDFRRRFEEGSEDKEALIAEIQSQLGDSVEKLLLIKAILGDEKLGREEGRS